LQLGMSPGILELIDETLLAHFYRKKYSILREFSLEMKKGDENSPSPPLHCDPIEKTAIIM
jgi:hypothetical protein